MNRIERKGKFINRILFMKKISDPELRELCREAFRHLTLDELMLLYSYDVITLEEPKTLQDCHNSFAWIRKSCKVLMKMQSNHSIRLRETQHKCYEVVRYFGAKGLTLEQCKLHEFYKLYESNLEVIRSLEAVIRSIESLSMIYNTKLEKICDYYDKHSLAFHDFCQLINMGESDARLNIKEVGESKEEPSHYKYLSKGIENDRSHPYYKQNKSNGMPLFNLIHKSMRLIIINEEVKEKIPYYLIDNIGLASGAITLKQNDDDGNIVA